MEQLSGSYRDLLAWQKGLDLVDAVYDVAALFPDDERYAPASQARRAAAKPARDLSQEVGKMLNGLIRSLA